MQWFGDRVLDIIFSVSYWKYNNLPERHGAAMSVTTENKILLKIDPSARKVMSPRKFASLFFTRTKDATLDSLYTCNRSEEEADDGVKVMAAGIN